MTLTDVLKDFAYLSTLILIGFELRKHIKMFQKFFIPTSLIAGTIGMFLSPKWLGTISPVYIPFSDGIGQWSGALVIVVCATMFLGLELNKVGRDGLAATFMAGTLHQGQMLVGLGLAALFGLFTAIPYQFGYMGVWGFYAGHGNATTVGNIIKEAGYWEDAVGVGVTFATIGILCGVIVGMIIINFGAKRGLTHVKMSFADMNEGERTGYIKPAERQSVGNGVTNVSSLDPLAFQLAIVGLVIVIGVMVRAGLMKISPIMKRFPLVGAVLVSSMVVGFIINKSPVLRERIDRKLMNRITGTALEYMITAAIATTSRQIFIDYALPLVVISVCMVLVNLVVCFFLGKRWLRDNPFETGVGLFGMACGVLATGLMLTKVMDPNNETTAASCISTSSTLGYAWQIPYMVVGSLMIFTAPKVTTIISLALFLFFLIGGELIFGRKKKS